MRTGRDKSSNEYELLIIKSIARIESFNADYASRREPLSMVDRAES